MKIANHKHGRLMVTSGSKLRGALKDACLCPGHVFDDMPSEGSADCLSLDHDWNEIADRCDECRYKNLKSDEEPDWEDCQ
jgi:hypothetical protein